MWQLLLPGLPGALRLGSAFVRLLLQLLLPDWWLRCCCRTR
jgi:hypothetical protein